MAVVSPALRFVAVCMYLIVVGTSGVDDFQDHGYHGYDIIYHGDYDLLLAIHDNNCYFVYTPDNLENKLVKARSYVSKLQHTEASLLYHIWTNASGEVTSSSLSAVRDKYGDLLADFRCQDKNIFEVDFFHSNNGGHTTSSPSAFPTSTSSASKTTPGGGWTHQYHRLCRGLSSGMHPHPDDCHKFIVCANGITFEEFCAPGTAFRADLLECVHTREVPGCSDH